MRFRATLLLIASLLLPSVVHAQAPPTATSLKARFMDASLNAPIAGVQVKLTNFADTTARNAKTSKPICSC